MVHDLGYSWMGLVDSWLFYLMVEAATAEWMENETKGQC